MECCIGLHQQVESDNPLHCRVKKGQEALSDTSDMLQLLLPCAVGGGMSYADRHWTQLLHLELESLLHVAGACMAACSHRWVEGSSKGSAAVEGVDILLAPVPCLFGLRVPLQRGSSRGEPVCNVVRCSSGAGGAHCSSLLYCRCHASSSADVNSSAVQPGPVSERRMLLAQSFGPYGSCCPTHSQQARSTCMLLTRPVQWQRDLVGQAPTPPPAPSRQLCAPEPDTRALTGAPWLLAQSRPHLKLQHPSHQLENREVYSPNLKGDRHPACAGTRVPHLGSSEGTWPAAPQCGS